MTRFWKNAFFVIGTFAAAQSGHAQNVDYGKLRSKDAQEAQNYLAKIQKSVIEKSTPCFQNGPSLVPFFDQRIQRASYSHQKKTQLSYSDQQECLQMVETHLWRKREPNAFEHYDILEERIGFDTDESGVIGDDTSEIWSKTFRINTYNNWHTEIDTWGNRLIDDGTGPVMTVTVRSLREGSSMALQVEENRFRKTKKVIRDAKGHYIQANHIPCHQATEEINMFAESKEAFEHFVEQVKESPTFWKKGSFARWFGERADAYKTACALDPHKPPQF